MTDQEMFDFCFNKIVEQGEPSINRLGACMYRSVNKNKKILKCAAGHFIPDEEYLAGFESLACGCDVTDYIGNTNVEFGLSRYFEEKGLNHKLLRSMQKAHDTASQYHQFINNFVQNMKVVALQYGLTMPEMYARVTV